MSEVGQTQASYQAADPATGLAGAAGRAPNDIVFPNACTMEPSQPGTAKEYSPQTQAGGLKLLRSIVDDGKETEICEQPPASQPDVSNLARL